MTLKEQRVVSGVLRSAGRLFRVPGLLMAKLRWPAAVRARGTSRVSYAVERSYWRQSGTKWVINQRSQRSDVWVHCDSLRLPCTARGDRRTRHEWEGEQHGKTHGSKASSVAKRQFSERINVAVMRPRWPHITGRLMRRPFKIIFLQLSMCSLSSVTCCHLSVTLRYISRLWFTTPYPVLYRLLWLE